jgi:hypothetical protein
LSIASIDYLGALEFGANDHSAGLFDRQSKSGDQFGQVRFGSKADIGASLIDVRFTPKSGHGSVGL